MVRVPKNPLILRKKIVQLREEIRVLETALESPSLSQGMKRQLTQQLLAKREKLKTLEEAFKKLCRELCSIVDDERHCSAGGARESINSRQLEPE